MSSERQPHKWISEPFTPHLRTLYAVKEIVKSIRTKYQKVEIVNTYLYGKCLFLDDKIQSSELDEFIYHESLTHPPMFTHPHPHSVLIVGGGEGATLREVLKHNSVDKVDMVDIDEELVKICEEYLPDFSKGAFNDPRVSLKFEDARKFLEKNRGRYDCIIIDLPEPLKGGPCYLLYTKEFYSLVYLNLADDGTVSVQSGTTHLNLTDLIASVSKTLSLIFPIVRVYQSFISSFQQPWGFCIGSKKVDPLNLSPPEIEHKIEERNVGKLKFYSGRCHQGLFSLPVYLKEALKKGRVIEDKQPLYWEI